MSDRADSECDMTDIALHVRDSYLRIVPALQHRSGELLFAMAILAMLIFSSCGSSSDGTVAGGGAPTTAAVNATAPPAPATASPPTVTVVAVTVDADYVTSEIDDPAHLPLGEAVFAAKCAGCHGSSGAGSERGRGLIDIAVEEPDRSVHIASVTYGIGEMLLRPGLLTPEEIDAVVSYVRLSLVAEDG